MSLSRDVLEWKAKIAPTISHERRFTVILKKLFGRQEKEVLGKVKKTSLSSLSTVTKAKDQFELYLDKVNLNEPKWNKEFVRTTIPLYRNMVKTSGDRVFSDLNLGVAFDLDTPEVRRFVNNKAIKFSGFVNGETNAGLSRIIRPIIERGGTIEDVRKRIQLGVQRRFNSSVRGTTPRARMIARTEMVGAANGGTLESAKQTKIIKFKAWLTSKDKKVRNTHRSAGRRYSRIRGIPLNKNFKVGTALLSAPGVAVGGTNKAKEVISCRCVLIFTRKGAGKSKDDTVKKDIEVKAPPVTIILHSEVREVLNELIEQGIFAITSRAFKEGVTFDNVAMIWKNIFGVNVNPKMVMTTYPTERIISKLLFKRDVLSVKQTFILHSRNLLQYIVEAKDGDGNSIDPSLDNKQVLRVERIFKIENNKRTVEHNYFGLLDPFRYSDYGKEILKRQLKLYRKTKLQTIELKAEGFGSYAWARYGFDIKDELKFEFFKSKLKVLLLPVGANEEEVDQLISKIGTIHELASVTFRDKKIGKKVLVNDKWDAFLNLTNKKQTSILDSYTLSVDE